jgi:hypothetical protein
MLWGRNQGCEFIESRCGQSSPYSNFIGNRVQNLSSADACGRGYCQVMVYI